MFDSKFLNPVSPADRVPMIPFLGEETWRICEMPDLGELNGDDPQRQHVVDHGFIRDSSGRWQLWACIRGTKAANTRLIFGWEGDDLSIGPWPERGIMLRGDPDLDESGVGAPFFLRWRDRWLGFYHSKGIRMLESDDGREWRRRIDADGTNQLYDGGRDVMVFPWNDRLLFYSTITCISRDGVHRCFVSCRATDDFRTWSDPVVVSEGGMAGSGPVNAESPFVVFRQGYYYLFRATSRRTVLGGVETFVYRSETPFHFGVHDDSKLVAVLPLKAPEIVVDGDREYISDLADFQGILLRRLEWRAE